MLASYSAANFGPPGLLFLFGSGGGPGAVLNYAATWPALRVSDQVTFTFNRPTGAGVITTAIEHVLPNLDGAGWARGAVIWTKADQAVGDWTLVIGADLSTSQPGASETLQVALPGVFAVFISSASSEGAGFSVAAQ